MAQLLLVLAAAVFIAPQAALGRLQQSATSKPRAQ
jgi:hypothetical protein